MDEVKNVFLIPEKNGVRQIEREYTEMIKRSNSNAGTFMCLSNLLFFYVF